jgi:sugar/nucleoside kinase (ribokinase family)
VSGENCEAIELLCIGNALVDVFAQGEEDIDFRFGLYEAVQHISIERMREILAMLPEFTPMSGGGGANVAKIAGALGLKAGFIGAAGELRDAAGVPDRFGRLFTEELSETGVITRIALKNRPTGICLVLTMNDGRVKIAAAPSAANELCEADIDEDLIKEAQVVVLDGFMLERKSLVQHIFRLADKYGAPVALDVSSSGLAFQRAVEIITYARLYPLIIFMNEDESRAFYSALVHGEGGAQGEEAREKSPGQKPDRHEFLNPEMINLFRDFTANEIFPILTVKLGVRGAVVFAGGNIYRESTIPVIPLETTGAGDAFCAAFLGAWIRDKSLSECAALGNRAAREVLGVNGTKIDPKQLKAIAKKLQKN